MMTSRERVMRTLARTRPDRLPLNDAPWTDTLARWQSEGLPPSASLADYFGFDIDAMNIDASPRLRATAHLGG